MCAGLGTRLRPLTDRIPKPAVPFLGRPLIAHTFDWLRAAGVERVVINLHHLPERMRAAALDHARGLDLRFSWEPELLGTGGALVAARTHLEPVSREAPLLVMNGDCFYQLPPDALTRLAAAKGDALAALWLSADARYAHLANVDVDAQGRIGRIAGRPTNGATGTLAAYLGVQLLDDRLLDQLPASGAACMRDDGWLPALARGQALRGVDLGGAAYDLGTPERYLAAYDVLWSGEEAPEDAAVLAELRLLRSSRPQP